MGTMLKTKKGRSFYIHDTPGEKGTIIAAHGLTGNHKQFMHYQEALSGEYRFISYDILGRGNSDPALPETSIFTHAEDLTDLIEELEIEEPILIGYSMGAFICTLVATKIKPKALILLDGAGETDDLARELVLPSLNRMKKTYPSQESYVTEMKELYTRLLVEWNDPLKEFILYELKENSGHWIHKSDAVWLQQDFESFYDFDPHILADVSCPVFLLIATGSLGGNRSLFTEKSYELIKNVTRQLHTEHTSQNHYEIVLNKQPEVTKKIRNFLSN